MKKRKIVFFNDDGTRVTYDTSKWWTLCKFEVKSGSLKYSTVDLPFADGQRIFAGYNNYPYFNNATVNITLESSEGSKYLRDNEIRILNQVIAGKNIIIQSPDYLDIVIGDGLKYYAEDNYNGWLLSTDTEFSDANHCRISLQFSVEPKRNKLVTITQFVPAESKLDYNEKVFEQRLFFPHNGEPIQPIYSNAYFDKIGRSMLGYISNFYDGLHPDYEYEDDGLSLLKDGDRTQLNNDSLHLQLEPSINGLSFGIGSWMLSMNHSDYIFVQDFLEENQGLPMYDVTYAIEELI